jgi:uncharacterized protein YjbI with pentapeptide repeats
MPAKKPHVLLALGLASALLLSGAQPVVSAGAATPEDVERALSTGSCPNCDLVEANLSGIRAENGDFSGANLLDAVIYGGNLRGANLTGATLHGANLKIVDLTGAVGAVLDMAITDERTTCPNGSAGPCQ